MYLIPAMIRKNDQTDLRIEPSASVMQPSRQSITRCFIATSSVPEVLHLWLF